MEVDQAQARKFDRTLQQYLVINKRDAGMLVQNQLKHTLTGVGSRKKGTQVKGLRQLFLQDKPSASQIEREAKYLTHLKPASSKGAGRFFTVYAPKKSKKRKAILDARKRKRGYLQSTFLFNKWGNTKRDGSRKLYPVKIHTRAVEIRIQGGIYPKATWISKIPGIITHGKKKGYFTKALRNRERDMANYILRKQQEHWRKAH